jgi:transcriptional regulator with XRE-family HTH domain
MPSSDVQAKAWQLELSARVGKAVQRRRKALNLTAQQLAQRTVEIGYPVTRVAISKIESNVRAGKLDVAELLALAAALEIPPSLLLFPGYPDDDAEALPGVERTSVEAVRSISGRGGAVDLVDLVERRTELRWELGYLNGRLTPAMMTSKTGDDAEMVAWRRRIRSIKEQQVSLDDDIRRAKDELWGESHE